MPAAVWEKLATPDLSGGGRMRTNTLLAGQKPSEDHLAILPFSQEFEEDRDEQQEEGRADDVECTAVHIPLLHGHHDANPAPASADAGIGSVGRDAGSANDNRQDSSRAAEGNVQAGAAAWAKPDQEGGGTSAAAVTASGATAAEEAEMEVVRRSLQGGDIKEATGQGVGLLQAVETL